MASSSKPAIKARRIVNDKPPPRPTNFLFPLIKFLCKWLCIIAIWLITLGGALLLYYGHDLPDLGTLEQVKKHRSITLLAANGEILTRFGDLYGNYVDFEHIPKLLVQAVIATEDRRFFSHFGIDIWGLMRASYVNYRAGYIVQGGSTITQQLAKIVFLTPERTIKRKIQEMILAYLLEKKFTKQQILAIYLNRVYLGAGIYGITAASQYYFGKNLTQINIYEAAIIAGLLKAPSKYTPIKNAELSGKRAFQILLNMKEAGFITANEVASVKSKVVVLNTRALGGLKNLYFATWIVDQIHNFTNDLDSDLIIETTMDTSLEKYAEAAINKIIGTQGSKFDASEAAIVVLSSTGEILAMVGGTNYPKSSFNRATQARRQAGSAFKLFVYLAALENGYNIDSIVSDAPVTIGKWQPKNYTRKYLGNITLQEAFAKSINTVSVRISEDIGRDKVIELAHKLGITSDIPSHPSIALGSSEVNLLELTTAFATIASDGYIVWPYGIRNIKTKSGINLYKRNFPSQLRVLNSQTVIDIKTLLRNAISEGTGKAANLKNYNVYGKTGTTQEYRDAWFVGFIQNITVGVWVGNDNNKPMKKVTGGKLPAYIWKEFMTCITGDNIDFTIDELKEIYQQNIY